MAEEMIDLIKEIFDGTIVQIETSKGATETVERRGSVEVPEPASQASNIDTLLANNILTKEEWARELKEEGLSWRAIKDALHMENI